MSPIMDPSYAAKRREQQRRQEEDAEREATMEYVKPAIMLLAGFAFVSFWLATQRATDDVGAAQLIMAYVIVLAVSLAVGVLGLVIAAKLWLGGVGPLGLSILRLAGVYVVVDSVSQLLPNLFLLNLIVTGGIYCGLLMWLFELEATDSIMLALITYVLKMIAGFVVLATLLST